MTTARRREVRLGPHGLEVTPRADGSYLLRAPQPLAPYPRALTDLLARWARERPERTFLAERDGDGWRRISYAEAARAARALGQALLDRGCTAEHGLAILSENGIDHALLGLGAQLVGIPYAPISPPYSLLSTDFVKLRDVLGTFEPALVFARDVRRYGRALAAVGHATLEFAELLAVEATAAVDEANARVGPDTVAKILFTSGSTGLPKGVINTQRMLCSNQQMNVQAFPFFGDDLVMLDWSPWNHTAGGNQIFGMVLFNGGTLFIDDGKPTPSEMWKTIRNLREIAPTVYFNVPRGFEDLARVLEIEPELRGTFFSRLRMMWYAGAALAAPVFDAMRRLATETCGEEVMMTSGLGSTETAPSLTFANWHSEVSGNIGIPLPGVEVKLVPSGAKLELRARGPSITPGYLRRPDLTVAAFDDEGFYKMGDALRPLDPADFSRGFLFDGRISEDFKLSTGTWVSVGPLRGRLLALLQPHVRDVVLCGADRDDLTMLMIPDPRDESGGHDPAVRAAIRARLHGFALENPGSSTHVRRAIFLDAPPSIDAGEITDKGSLNNATLRDRRRSLVERLYAEAPDPDVIAID